MVIGGKFALPLALFCLVGCGLKSGTLQSSGTPANLDGWWRVTVETCASQAVNLNTNPKYTFDGENGTYQYQAAPGCTVSLDLGIGYPRVGQILINYLPTTPGCAPVGCDPICNVPAPSYQVTQDYAVNGGILTLRHSDQLCAASNVRGQDIITLRKQ